MENKKKRIAVVGNVPMGESVLTAAILSKLGDDVQVIEPGGLSPEAHEAQIRALEEYAKPFILQATPVFAPIDLYRDVPRRLRGVPIIPVRTEPKYNRNELCHCSSGKKYKHCCGK